MFKKLSYLLFFVVSLNVQNMQGQTKTVVLINSVASEATLSQSGDILEVHREIPDHMRGYAKAPVNAFQYSPLRVGQTIAAVPEDRPETAAVPEEPTPDVIGNAIVFADGSAILDPSAMTRMDQIIRNMRSGGQRIIQLNSLYDLESATSRELAQNRLDACKSYLELKGVQGSNILIILDAANTDRNYINYSIR